ncbi:hypothetical protein [Corallococcus exiguus]|uniref:hypothetical protein n=1 Tax=Corallococcus exiguus TaxID=83462 RepID=UPI0014720FC6|nr:hypothetical protein [Corallococcus exiguus]NNB84573.1 hypothetical protein [Corallococcus exiguus]
MPVPLASLPSQGPMHLLFAAVNWNSVVTSLLTSTTASGAIVLATLWLARNWLGARIKNEVDSQYSHKLETHKSSLRIESEREIEKNRSKLKGELDSIVEQFRADTAEQRAVHTVAASVLNSTINAGAERKLKAIDAHWLAMVQGRQKALKLIYQYDLLRKEELKSAIQNNTAGKLRSPELSELEDFDKTYESAYFLRPYIDEVPWTHFYAHQFLLGRMLTLLVLGFFSRELTYWLDDATLTSILRAALSEEEFKSIEGMPAGGITKAVGLLETKFINSARETISGQVASEAALTQARQMSEKLAKASLKQPVSLQSLLTEIK